MQNTNTVNKLAELTKSINFKDLPTEVINQSKRLILDSIGCMLGGSVQEQGKRIINHFQKMGGIQQATVLGTGKKLPLLNAIYINSYLATVLDFDDTYDGHPGSTIVPVALNSGESDGVSGRDIIASVVAGYEIGIRVSNGIKPTPERTRRVRGINTWQIFCATATAAKLLCMNQEQITHALSHAAIHASVPSLRKWGFRSGNIQWLKNNLGWASYGGVLSAQLAQLSFIGDPTIFDGEDGFWIMASSDQCDYRAITEPLSNNYYILKVHTKPYPACRHIHPTLDAVKAIAEKSSIPADRISRIDIYTFYEVVENYAFYPTVPFDVAYSAPYLIALLILKIPVGLSWFDSRLIGDDRLKTIAQKISFHEWEEASRAYPLVKRELISKAVFFGKDNSREEKEVRIPKGDPRNPMTDEELTDKFTSLAGPVLGMKKTEEVKRIVSRLEELDNVTRLTSLLSTDK
jgi:2-methylcitrate dehydratase PrpD